MDIEQLNTASKQEAFKLLLNCCGSQRWAKRMSQARPFPDVVSLLETAQESWWDLEERDWLEAFAAHPRIGERKVQSRGSRSSLSLAQSTQWSLQEQSGMNAATGEISVALAAANQAYEDRFSWIYIVCATGKSGLEMLELCRQRLNNDRATELRIAALEQCKITELRLKKLMGMLD